MGVDLFFVLSGFLITTILLKSRKKAGYFLNFYARRCLRIFPLYYGYLLFFLSIGAVQKIPDFMWGKMWWYLPFLQNFASTFAPARLGGPHHFWSLAVEEHFYLLWPWVVSVFPPQQLRKICAGLLAATFLFRCLFLTAGLDVFSFTLCRMDGLSLGAWLALVHGDVAQWKKLARFVRFCWWPGLALATTLYLLHSGSRLFFLQAAKYSLTAVACAGFLVAVMEPSPTHGLGRTFSFPWLCGLGQISYGFYVFHPYLMQRLMGVFFRESWSPWQGKIGPAMMADFLLVFCLTLALSLVSWNLFEKPFLRLKRHYD